MRIQVRGRMLGYDDTGGTGVPLVLIHGFPLDRTIWAAQLRGLAGVARVVAPDLRGFGESAVPLPSPFPPPTMEDYAVDVAALLDALGIERAVVGGVSMGGYVALAFHRAFPARLCGLVLVDTRAGPDSAEARKARDDAAGVARARGAAAVGAAMLEKMLTPATALADPGMARTLAALMGSQPVEGIVGALAAIRDRPDSGPSLAAIAVPTLVVCGAEDALIPPKESEILRDGIPGARLALVAGAAHLPNHERPEEFNRVLREFLAKVPC